MHSLDGVHDSRAAGGNISLFVYKARVRAGLIEAAELLNAANTEPR